jgi:transposase InsO family protein
MIRIAQAMRVARSNLVRRVARRPPPTQPPLGYSQRGDDDLLARVRTVVDARGSYGYRRVAALLNRTPGTAKVNHKRVYRVMRAAGLLLERHTGKSTRTHTKAASSRSRATCGGARTASKAAAGDGQRFQVVYLNRLESAEAVMQALADWFEDYNSQHPTAPTRGCSWGCSGRSSTRGTRARQAG